MALGTLVAVVEVRADDVEVARELEAIAARLAALTSEHDHDRLGAELRSIREDLRRLGEANEQVGRWLVTRLDLPSEPTSSLD